MSIPETILTSLATTGVIGGLFIWLFKESLKTSLKLDMEARLNTQRADLERVRDAFQFQVQQAMLSIQIQTEKTHEIYPELYEKLRVAEGAIGSLLGLRESPTWEEYSVDDLKSLMERRGVVSGQIERIAQAINQNRRDGLKEMNEYLRMIELNEAKGKHHEAKNYVVLKNLYMTDEIAEECFTICKHLWAAIVDANPEYVQYDSFKKNMAEVEKLMTSVKVKMRSELTHKEIA